MKLFTIILTAATIFTASADFTSDIARQEIKRYTAEYKAAEKKNDSKKMRYLLNIIKTNRAIINLSSN